MTKFVPILANAPLFKGIDPQALAALLPTLSPKIQTFTKDCYLLHAGQTSDCIGILLSGQAHAFRLAPDGTEMPVTALTTASVFGDVLGGASVVSPVSIVATTPCVALFLPYQALLQRASTELATAQSLLLQNLLCSISDKYFELSHRVDLLVLKSLRAKLATYLLAESARANSHTFTIPYTRMRLANYLNCERSALSRELGKMQQEGLLETYKSSFKICNRDALLQVL